MAKIRKTITSFVRFINFHIIWKLIFKFNSHCKIDENLYVFADAYAVGLTDNMIPVYEILKLDPKNKFVFCFAPENCKSLFEEGRKTYKSFRTFSAAYAKAKTVILTEGYLPASANRPRNGTDVIQLWHACGAFKKWGYSTLNADWGADKKAMDKYPVHRNYTLVSVSSKNIIPCYAEAFRCDPSIIKPLGAPRTDIFFRKNYVDESRQLVYKHHGIPANKKLLLYAPTFRGSNIRDAHNNECLNIKELKNSLSDDYVLIIKLHPYVKNKLSIDNDCTDFASYSSDDITTQQYLCAADMLITDYSSVIFDYSLLSRPIIFFAYDLEEYEKQRSFYFSYKNFVPGEIVYNSTDIPLAVKRAESNGIEKVAEFRVEYMSACDGESCEHIINYLETK